MSWITPTFHNLWDNACRFLPFWTLVIVTAGLSINLVSHLLTGFYRCARDHPRADFREEQLHPPGADGMELGRPKNS